MRTENGWSKRVAGAGVPAHLPHHEYAATTSQAGQVRHPFCVRNANIVYLADQASPTRRTVHDVCARLRRFGRISRLGELGNQQGVLAGLEYAPGSSAGRMS